MAEEPKTEQPKVWYKSKVLWVNVIAVVAMLVQAKYGFIIEPVDQVAILGVINLILRATTHGGLELRESK